MCPRLPAWRLEPLEDTRLSRNRRKDGFDGNSSLVRHSADGVAALKHRESNHGKSGKGRAVLGVEMAVAHLAKSRWFRSNIMVVWNRIMVLSNHGTFPVWGSRNGVCYRTGIPTLADAQFREPKRLKSFEKKPSGCVLAQGPRSGQAFPRRWGWGVGSTPGPLFKILLNRDQGTRGVY